MMVNKKNIKVLIVDDIAFVRAGIRLLIEQFDNVEVVGEAGDGKEALALLAELEPNLVLMDVEMPVMNGIESARLLKERDKNIKIIMLTSHDKSSHIFDAFAAGADGYVLKDNYAASIELAISTVRLGSVWLDPAIAREVLKSTTELKTAAPQTPVALSEQEEKVLEKVAVSGCEGGACHVDPLFLAKLQRFSGVRKPTPF